MSAPAVGRRAWIAQGLALAALPALALLGRRAAAQAEEPQVVKLVAQRFHYTPAQFEVKAGRPVVLEFTALDFVHGFNLPDLKLRADLPPGTVTRVRFTVDKPGSYDFLCDNFCGDKHEEMSGRMLVTA
ncbi:cupredoxin domain-containing protein [Caenimonas terrae]|uniref:Nitrous-oxide reductase n=1 Tax=Caenimonas terrae TaxID=696074 RepID=A0ABW0NC76_9BURK